MSDILDTILELLKTMLGYSITLDIVVIFLLTKFVPNEKLEAIFNGLGSMATIGMSKFAWWNKIEAWIIDGLAVSVTAFIKGLRSDNPA